MAPGVDPALARGHERAAHAGGGAVPLGLSLIGSRRVEIVAPEAEALRARLASERWREWSGTPRLRALLELVAR